MNPILQFDQQATLALNGSESLFWDNLMITVTNTWSWSLVILAIIYIIFHNKNVKEGFIILLTIGLMIFVADRICSGLVKPTVARWRPTQDPQIMYLIDVVEGYRGGRFGFFSGHACNTFCMATFLALLFRNKVLTFTLYFWSITTTFTRLYLGVHYLGDVTVGLILGIGIGYLFHYILKQVQKRMNLRQRLSADGLTSSGFKKSDIHILVSIIFFNYNIVLIAAMMRSF
ncbi:MAG: phosphatase PAP2 family protein [Bacteroidaceae bacterium]|nr:phosphatase PAP2 family protein [Bacteroidaceae bacterium]